MKTTEFGCQEELGTAQEVVKLHGILKDWEIRSRSAVQFSAFFQNELVSVPVEPSITSVLLFQAIAKHLPRGLQAKVDKQLRPHLGGETFSLPACRQTGAH